MLPGKIFLEAVRTGTDHSIGNKSTYKLNLILNEIYYDEVRQFHTKYLCVNARDILTVELYAIESRQLLGITVITDVYKHMLDNHTVDIKSKDPSFNNDVTIKLCFQAIPTFHKKNFASSIKRGEDTFVRSPPKEREAGQIVNQVQLSFNNNRDIFVETLGDTSRSSLFGAVPAPVKAGLIQEEGEGESLQSLAQQRQKILGELFGKFKRER